MSHKRRRIIARIKKIDSDELQLIKKRTDIASAIILFFLAVLIIRLWYLQIHRGAEYERLADNNRVRMLDVTAPRGTILDREGRVIVANRPSFNIVWVREDSPDPDEIIKKLSRILNVEIAVLLQRVRKSADNPRHLPIFIAEDIDWQTLLYIENNYYELPGIRIEILPRREYRYGNVASHLIGYLGEVSAAELEELRWDNYQPGDLLGKRGLEKLYEDQLRGEKGRQYMEVDAHGFEQRRLKGIEPLPGNNIRLTIDIDLQQAAEEAMAGAAGAVVAMEVDSGRLLALASSPPLELENFIGGISHKNWQALLTDERRPLVYKAIQGQYPPGSTYKIVTALAGLSEGEITPDTTFFCPGYMFFGNRRYGCWKQGGHGKVNLHRALAESCDVYFYQVGLKTGVDTLAQYARGLGLGDPTGLRFAHEKGGLIPTSSWKMRARGEAWQEGETLSVSIGQGFNLATPLQICLMTAALANNGTLYQPQLVEAIREPEGNTIDRFTPLVTGKVPATSRSLSLIREGLVAAVNGRHGTGRAARLEEILVAGKTGTAQVIRLEKYKEVDEEDLPYQYMDHAWFTSFAPAGNPEIAVTVLMEHGGHGGSAAAPIARAVLARYFDKKSTPEAADIAVRRTSTLTDTGT